jgi:hypothetical protein
LIDGRSVRPDVQLSLLEAEPRRLVGAVPDVFRHMAAFKGALVVPGLLWLVAGLAALGVPTAVVLALMSATRNGSVESEPGDEPH